MRNRSANTGGFQHRLQESGGARFWILAVLALLVVFVMSLGPGLFEPVFVLAFGWVQFLQRTMPAMSWNWDLIGMSAAASIGSLLLVQNLVGGIFNKVAVRCNLSRRWSWRWTWTGFVGLLLLFLVGMAVGGIVHQVGWMMSSNEPMIEAKNRKWRDYSNMKQLDLEVRLALEDEGGDVENARRMVWGSRGGFLGGSPIMQMYHVLLVQDGDKKVVGRLVFPRNGQQREKVGGYFCFDSGECNLCPWPKFQEIIKTNRAHLVTF